MSLTTPWGFPLLNEVSTATDAPQSLPAPYAMSVADFEREWRHVLKPVEQYHERLLARMGELRQQKDDTKTPQMQAQIRHLQSELQAVKRAEAQRLKFEFQAAKETEIQRLKTEFQLAQQTEAQQGEMQRLHHELQCKDTQLAQQQEIINDMKKARVSSKNTTEVWEALATDKECTLCLGDVLLQQCDILQCCNGHLICSDCAATLPSDQRHCLTCFDPGPLVKNAFAMNLRTVLAEGHEADIFKLETDGRHPCGEPGCNAMVRLRNYQGELRFVRCLRHRPNNEGLPCQKKVDGFRCGQPGTWRSRGPIAYCWEHLRMDAAGSP
tara:strand:+ start:11153 stop:12127 length:975 start_codon:yes stop_codon:yes gene_type:complete